MQPSFKSGQRPRITDGGRNSPLKPIGIESTGVSDTDVRIVIDDIGDGCGDCVLTVQNVDYLGALNSPDLPL
ncbi:hypothetical protein HKCCE3408_08595 [Rhodobacterales bacterium HKCCE3408]|nr:hypothetical protein [Rhodobacterales bacterium HKCCE3408]